VILNSGPVLAKYFTTCAISPSVFALVYISDRVSHFCLGLASDLDPLTSASQIAGITGVCVCV
jgi:hypothetical protein